MENIKNLILFGIGILLLFLTFNYMKNMDYKLIKTEFKESNGKNFMTTNFKLMGIKKFGSDILWIKQVLDTGSFKFKAEHIKENSELVSYLDPYFISNYYFSGTVISLIKSYQRYDYGIEILKRGIKYNPKDKYLRSYISGILAASKGNIEGVLMEFEKILKTHSDDRMVHTVAFIYEEKYKKTKLKKYLKKSLYYWKMLLNSKDENYRKRAEKKVIEFENIK